MYDKTFMYDKTLSKM